MARPLRLSPSDREFFLRVMAVITQNPFSEERPAIGLLISAGFSQQATLREQQFNRALDEKLATLSARGEGRFSDYVESDSVLVAYAYLFHLYIHHIDEMDGLIKEEAKREKPVAAPFAGDLLGRLRELGFSAQEALHYFGLFYQLRRAYYFIVESLAGNSACMQRLRKALWNNVFTSDIVNYDKSLWNRMEDFSLLLLGETGTGKGAAASAIGRSGFIPFDPRKGAFIQGFQRTFFAANLSQFPESLIEAELFGHCKGAFTGAVRDHKGLLEHCSRYGSLFLDEIGDLSMPVQVKLLQVLQERTFTSVGSDTQKRFSGRVIAATNQSIDRLRHSGAFRDDFFYRLSSDVIVVPPLRQRLRESPSELSCLAAVVVTRILGFDDQDITTRVVETLEHDLSPDYPWPGNVRELEQAIRRILVTGHYKPSEDARFRSADEELQRALGAIQMPVSELVGRYCAALYEQFGSYEAVARHTFLDRRTVKKYLSQFTGPNVM